MGKLVCIFKSQKCTKASSQIYTHTAIKISGLSEASHADTKCRSIVNYKGTYLAFTEKQLEEVKDFIAQSSESTRIYFGADSSRFKSKGKWHATYTIVVVIHKDGCKGAKVFGYSETEPDYDKKFNRPAYRMMQECAKVSELFLVLTDFIGDREVEIHLDINPNEMHGSSCALHQAIGYVKGMCGIDAKVKPHAFAASYAADRAGKIC